MKEENIWNDDTTEARMARWEALWALEDLPRPLWFVPADPILSLLYPYHRKKKSLIPLITDRKVQLSESLRWNRLYGTLQRFFYHDDFIPHLQPQLGIGVFASAFGSEVIYSDEQLPMTHPAIQLGEPAQRVYEFSEPTVEAGQLGDVLDYASYFSSEAGSRYPIAMTDLQGPLDTAYLIWNATDFMIAMLDYPKEVHYLMRMVTDLIIKFIHEFKRRVDWFVPAHFPPVYLPDGKGIALSEDVLALLGPQLYKEFSLPYLNELSEEFGGVLIHSCGNIAHQMDVLEQVHQLRGINFGVSETRFEVLWERFGGRVVLIPHCSPVGNIAKFSGSYEWIQHVLNTKTTNRGLALMVTPPSSDIRPAEIAQDTRKQSNSIGEWLELLSFGARVRKMIQNSR